MSRVMSEAETQTLNGVVEYFKLDPRGLYPPVTRRLPIEIPNTGRGDLALLFKHLGFKVGAEIGVELGHYSEILARRNPGVHLYCVDAWQTWESYREHVRQAKLDAYYEQVVERMKPFNATVIRKFSVDAAKDFKDRSLDFCYVDAAHDFLSVTMDLVSWLPKLRSGAVIGGHDFCRRTDMHGKQRYVVHVEEVIMAWTQAHHVAPWFLLGRKECVEGETRDRPRSWFWVVP